MTDKRLMAAIALFRELHDNKHDIYAVLSEFIRTGILLESKWSFNSYEFTQILERNFGFTIPEAVIRSCLKNRLIRHGELHLDNGTYNVTDSFDRSKDISGEFNKYQQEYADVSTQLISFTNHSLSIPLREREAQDLINDFGRYLLNESISKQSASHISHFIISHQTDQSFKSKLNRIEEGLVLYVGIKHSTDTNLTSNWPVKLTIFLDTEHLFNATGLNGELFKRVFDDFYKLIKELNRGDPNSPAISLKYFVEVKDEVENFFASASRYVDTGQAPPAFKPAMVAITDGCKSKSDVLAKKANFYDVLRRKQIEIEDSCDYYANHQLNIESQSSIDVLHNKFRDRSASKESIADTLKQLTKINVLRNGQNNVGLERVVAILMTEHSLTTAIALSDLVYPGNGAVPYATNIEFMTERLWFKLNRGFGSDRNLPAIFDVVTKAQLALSGLLTRSVSDQFKILNDKFDKGIISTEEAALFNHELRSKTFRPEEITFDRVGESIEFLKGNYIEDALREKSLLHGEALSGRQAKAKLEKIMLQKKTQLIDPLKKSTRRQFIVYATVVYALLPIAALYFLIKQISANDSPLSIILGFTSLITLTPHAKYKFINAHIKKFLKSRYLLARRNIEL